jgi:DNA-binding NarL/FixJ family response regulator
MGGTLMVSRAVKNHSFYKKRLEDLKFPDVTLTALEKDALDMLISDMKPDLVMMGARFYQRSTPFLMRELKTKFPSINMAALSIGHYPSELAMYFILNGVKSYVTSFEGIDQWYAGLETVWRGRTYISPDVDERISMRQMYPASAGDLSYRLKEIILLMCNGFKDVEIAETLHISRRTVTTEKTEIFTTLNVRNPIELILAAQHIGLVEQQGASFFPKDFVVNPLPDYLVFNRRRFE